MKPVMKSHVPRLKHKVTKYWNYKKFDREKFTKDIKEASFSPSSDPNLSYDNFTQVFRGIVDKHAPLKTKILRRNTAPFMTQDLQKAIYSRSRLKNKFNKNWTKENEILYKNNEISAFLFGKSIKESF